MLTKLCQRCFSVFLPRVLNQLNSYPCFHLEYTCHRDIEIDLTTLQILQQIRLNEHQEMKQNYIYKRINRTNIQRASVTQWNELSNLKEERRHSSSLLCE